MAELTFNSQLTQLQQVQKIGPGGDVLTIAEILDEENKILSTSVSTMANGIRSHVASRRTSLPTIYPRKINQGATTTYSQTEQIQEDLMLLESMPEIDEQLIDPYPNPDEMRASELVAYLEAFSQAFTENLIYGDKGEVGEIDGWATIYNALSFANVRGVSGTGSDLTSLWITEWNPRALTLLYPKDHPSVGLSNKDLKKKRVTDSSGNPYMAYCNQLKWVFGWMNQDARALQRVCNIETTGATNNLIVDASVRELIKALTALPKMGAGKNVAIYGNRTSMAQFNIWANEKANGFYYEKNISGRPLVTFQGVPIHLVEQILDTESALT